jgi:hypothetical protein
MVGNLYPAGIVLMTFEMAVMIADHMRQHKRNTSMP